MIRLSIVRGDSCEIFVERFFKDRRAVQRFRSGRLGKYVQQLANELSELGYARLTIRVKVRVAYQFGRWLKRCRIPLENLTPSHVQRYVCRHGSVKHGDGRTLNRLLQLLKSRGIMKDCSIAAIRTPAECVAEQFAEYLQQERSLNPATIQNHRIYARLLLTHRFGSTTVELRKLRPQDIVVFVRHEAARRKPSGMNNVASALRSFLAYAQFQGLTGSCLVGAVPTVAQWAVCGVPKALSHDQVRSILLSCDRRTPVGQRDYAVLLLLARLGLRAGEVAALNLEDVNWDTGTIAFRRKGGKASELPLPTEVGEALAAYLRRDRPDVECRRIFLRASAPLTGLNGKATGLIVKRALARAGIRSASKGAHQLRHTLATLMLRH